MRTCNFAVPENKLVYRHPILPHSLCLRHNSYMIACMHTNLRTHTYMHTCTYEHEPK